MDYRTSTAAPGSTSCVEQDGFWNLAMNSNCIMTREHQMMQVLKSTLSAWILPIGMQRLTPSTLNPTSSAGYRFAKFRSDDDFAEKGELPPVGCQPSDARA